MDKSEVLAVVGNREITRGDLESLLDSLNSQTAAQFRSPGGMNNLLRELVNQELFYLAAVEEGLDKEEEFLAEVEKMKANILKQYCIGKHLNNISVNENDAENYYHANKSAFSAPPSVKASHILVDTLEEAQDIAALLKDGLSFEDAARQYSKCPSSQQGGDLGYFTRGRMVPEFEKAAFEMEEGQTGTPVKTQFGYHLIKVYDRKDGDDKSFDEVRAQIHEQLLAQKQQNYYQVKVDELKAKYPVKFNI